MKKIEELNKLIIQSEKRKEIIHKEYLDSIKEFKREYLNKKAVEDKLISQLYEEKFAYLLTMRLIDQFDVDDLGNVLAKLLSKTEDIEYIYNRINFYSRSCFVPNRKEESAVIYPKGRIICDENKYAEFYKDNYLFDSEIIFLKDFDSFSVENNIKSFYNYASLIDKNNINIFYSYPFSSIIKTYPQIKEYIDYVLESHIEEYGELKPIDINELNQRLDEYLRKFKLIKIKNNSKTRKKENRYNVGIK